jgi:hypothetical protein
MEKPGVWYSVFNNEHVSLACRPGKLLVRAVYKVFALPSNGKISTVLNLRELGFLGSNPSPVRRCDLELPPFTPTPAAEQAARDDVWDSEKEAAVRSKELNCKDATGFTNLQVGRWYSDTATFDFAGCEGLKKPERGTAQPCLTSATGGPVSTSRWSSLRCRRLNAVNRGTLRCRRHLSWHAQCQGCKTAWWQLNSGCEW